MRPRTASVFYICRCGDRLRKMRRRFNTVAAPYPWQHHGVPGLRRGRQSVADSAVDFARHDCARSAGDSKRCVYAIQTGEQTIQNPTRMPGLNYVSKDNPLLGKFRAMPVSHLILFAFDAETGKQLYSSNEAIPNWMHFSEPVVALGKVFVVTHDAHVYAFGL